MAANEGAVHYTRQADGPSGLIRLRWHWRSDTSGNATHLVREQLWSYLYSLVTLPGTDDEQPTNLYDVRVRDRDDFDILRGKGVDRSATADEEVLLQVAAQEPYAVAAETHQIEVSGAGSENSGVVIVYAMVTPIFDGRPR